MTVSVEKVCKVKIPSKNYHSTQINLMTSLPYDETNDEPTSYP